MNSAPIPRLRAYPAACGVLTILWITFLALLQDSSSYVRSLEKLAPGALGWVFGLVVMACFLSALGLPFLGWRASRGPRSALSRFRTYLAVHAAAYAATALVSLIALATAAGSEAGSIGDALLNVVFFFLPSFVHIATLKRVRDMLRDPRLDAT